MNSNSDSYDDMINGGENGSSESHADDSGSARLTVGTVIGDEYVIGSFLRDEDAFTQVYEAKKWGSPYFVRLHRGIQPSEKLLQLMSGANHPNLTRIIEFGEYNGSFFEISEYYPEGSLSNAGDISVTQLQNVVIPAINEGLHELHVNGTVHGRLHPDNLFFSDSRSRVVIGDFGVGGYRDGNGRCDFALNSASEYSPVIKDDNPNRALTPAHDYLSFGLIIFRLALGYSLLGGKSDVDRSLILEKGIELPFTLSEKLRRLIHGLTESDESKRWDYEQIKKWGSVDKATEIRRNVYANVRTERQLSSFVFGIFDDNAVVVSSLAELADAMKSHWEQALVVIRKNDLIGFIRQFDAALADEVKKLSAGQVTDSSVYRLLLRIDDSEQISFCGKTYQTLEDYISCLYTGKDETAKRFFTSGMLFAYLRKWGYDSATVDKMEAIAVRNSKDEMTSIMTICLTLQGRKSIDINGVEVDSLDSLVSVLGKCTLQEIDDLIRSSSFIAWLSRLGYDREAMLIKGND